MVRQFIFINQRRWDIYISNVTQVSWFPKVIIRQFFIEIMSGSLNINFILEDEDTYEEPLDSNYQNDYEIKPEEQNKEIIGEDNNENSGNSKDNDGSSGNSKITMLEFTKSWNLFPDNSSDKSIKQERHAAQAIIGFRSKDRISFW